MSGHDTDATERAAELRRAFDASFALPPPDERAVPTRLLSLRLGSDRYALRLEDVAALVADRKIVPLETRIAEVLGLAGLRGALLPVYDLGALLGYGTLAAPPRWFVSLAGPEPLALAFAQLEGYLEAPADALRPVPPEAARRYVKSLVKRNGPHGAATETLAVLDAAALAFAIGERAAVAKER